MLTIEKLLSINKEDLQKASGTLSADDILKLTEWLSQKDDKIRYPAFLLLQYRSSSCDDVYPYFDVFRGMLKSENSYQRSIGLMLIAENAKWDKTDKINDTIDDYLLILNDEKPITVRQCIQALLKIVPYKNYLHNKIAEKLININILQIKETMRKLILMDILSVLAAIRKYDHCDSIEEYIFNALSGGLLDKKSKKEVENMLGKG